MTSDYDKTLIEVTVIGKDRKGVVADITNFIFRSGGNIEKINQNVVRGLFGMQLEASFKKVIMEELDRGLKQLSEKLHMEIKVHYQEPNRLRNIAILVSKEDHCLLKILEAKKRGDLKANLVVVIASNDSNLKSIVEEAGIPFHIVNYTDQLEAESRILKLNEQ